MTTAHLDDLEVVADPDVPVVRATRTFDAPPRLVFRAHVEEDLVARWLVPNSLEMVIDVWDCRSGGSYRYLHRRDGETFAFRGCFHDIRDDELIVQTFAFEDNPDVVALERLEFHPIDDGRTRLVTASLVDSFVTRDQWMASGMVEGMHEVYQHLAELVVSLDG
jgi:uncharacterized protein YndB with AHSA1/START domain